MMSKRTPVSIQTQRYDSLIPPVDAAASTAPTTPTPDAVDGWSPMKTQPDESISRASSQKSMTASAARATKPSLSVASQRASQSIPGPPMSSMWLDDNSDEETKPESRWKGLRRSSKTNSTISMNLPGNSSSHGIPHSSSFPLLPLRESTKSDSLRSSSSSNYNESHSQRQSSSDKSIGADTEHSSVSSPVPSVGAQYTPKTSFTPKQTSGTPKSSTTSPSRLKSPLRRSESGSKWSVNSIFSRSPRHKKSSSISSGSDLTSSISRPYNFSHVNHMDLCTHVSSEAMAAPVPVPDSPNPHLSLQSPLQRNKSTSSAHNALKNGLRSVKDRALGHSPSKSLSGESFDASFGGPISKTSSNATSHSVHTTHSQAGAIHNASKPMRPRRPDDMVLPRGMGGNEDESHAGVLHGQARRLSNSSSNYSSNSTVGSTAKSQVGITAATTPSMSPDGRDARFSSVQSEHAARVANLLKDNSNLNRASPANSPNPNLNAFPAPNLSATHRHSWRFSDADLDIEEEEEIDGESETTTSPSASPRIPQRSERRRGSTSYDVNGFLQTPGSAPQVVVNSPRLSQQFESSPQALQTPQTPSSSSSSNAGFRRKNHGLGLIKNQTSSDSIGSSWTSPGSDFVEQHNWLCQTAPSDLESAASTPNASQTTFRRSALLPSPLLPQQQQQLQQQQHQSSQGQQQQAHQQQPYITNGRHLSTSSLPSHGAILEDLAEENLAHRPSITYEQTQTWL
ncbi:hypothetical protein CKK34_0530 [Yarrowia sp. E02]|nr:hypothetical protein CKK34_0530 [Yarrowia sp. E02]